MTTKKPPASHEVKKYRNTSRYRKLRKRLLSRNPLCVLCLKQGKHAMATDMDHIKPLHTHWELRWDEANLQMLCFECHNKKTAGENAKPKDSTWLELDADLRRMINEEIQE